MDDDRIRAGSMLVTNEGEVDACIPVANTFTSRFWGLMGKPPLGEKDGLFLADCARVHTCFMRYPIDVLYLGPDLKGIEVETLAPWRLGRKVKGARHVLEMSAGFFDGVSPSSVKLVGN